MMIIEFANNGNLRSNLSNNFNNILRGNKIGILHDSLIVLQKLHNLGYIHRDIHSKNILQVKADDYDVSYISDFGLSGPENEQKSDNVYGVMTYIAPEVL